MNTKNINEGEDEDTSSHLIFHPIHQGNSEIQVSVGPMSNFFAKYEPDQFLPYGSDRNVADFHLLNQCQANGSSISQPGVYLMYHARTELMFRLLIRYKMNQFFFVLFFFTFSRCYKPV